MQPRQAETPPHRSECVAQSEQFEEKFQLVMAAPADEREHAFTVLALKL
jgi:hypothetical protein